MSALRSVDTANYAHNTVTTTTLTVPAPAGIEDGDLLVAVLFIATVTTTTVTPPTGFAGDSIVLAPGARPFYSWVKTASGESGDYTFTLTAGRRNVCAIVACFDGSLLSGTFPTTWDNAGTYTANATSKIVTTETNAVADQFGLLAVAEDTGNDLSAVVWGSEFAANGWTLVAQEDANDGLTGPGEQGVRGAIALYEATDSDDFTGFTWTVTPSTSADGWKRLIRDGLVEVPPAGGGGTNVLHIPQRRYQAHDLPYDLHTIRLGDRTNG